METSSQKRRDQRTARKIRKASGVEPIIKS